jgi:hypothetical protein
MYEINESVERGKIKYTIIWTGPIPSSPDVFSPMCVCPARPQAEQVADALNRLWCIKHT